MLEPGAFINKHMSPLQLDEDAILRPTSEYNRCKVNGPMAWSTRLVPFIGNLPVLAVAYSRAHKLNLEYELTFLAVSDEGCQQISTMSLPLAPSNLLFQEPRDSDIDLIVGMAKTRSMDPSTIKVESVLSLVRLEK